MPEITENSRQANPRTVALVMITEDVPTTITAVFTRMRESFLSIIIQRIPSLFLLFHQARPPQ
jgi:hypothetical protein